MIINEKYVKGQMLVDLQNAQDKIAEALQCIGWDFYTENDDAENRDLKRILQAAYDNIGVARNVLANPPKPIEEATGTKDTKETQETQAYAEKIGEVCEKCGSAMVQRQGKSGAFMACSAYPKCKNTKSLVLAGKEV